jgi:ArsR family transcriptional regulator
MLAPLVNRVIAVDESPVMLAAGRERTRHFANVEWRHGALESLPIDDETIDLAMIVLVLHHLPDPARAVEEASRVLRPSGRLIVVDMMPHERTEYRDEMGHQWLGFDQESVLGWCQTAGLERPWYRSLPPQSETKGPLLFVAAAEKPH